MLRNYKEDKVDREEDNEETDDDEHENEEEEADGAHGTEEDEADGDNGFEEDLGDGENAVEEVEADGGHGFEEDEANGELEPEGLVISAPHLQSLEISGWSARNCQLINVSSLVEAKLACNFGHRGRVEEEDEDFTMIQNTFRGLLSSFVHVNSLTVGTRAMEVSLPKTLFH